MDGDGWEYTPRLVYHSSLVNFVPKLCVNALKTFYSTTKVASAKLMGDIGDVINSSSSSFIR